MCNKIKHLNNKALERGGEVDTVDSCVRGNHIKDLIPALFFRKRFNKQKKMELKTAIEILEYHQEWRLGKREDIIHEPKKLTEALDMVLNEVKKYHLADVSGSVYLTENQIAELAQIGSQHLYLGAMDEGRISYGGIMEILKRYEEIRKTDR